MAFIRKERANGATLVAIADTMTSMGFRTRRGGPWRQQYASRLLLKGGRRR